MTFENEDSKSVDATKLFQLLLANSDDAMIETQILDVFTHTSDLLAEIKQKLKKIGMDPDGQAAFELGLTAMLPLVTPHLLKVHKTYLRLTSIASAPKLCDALDLRNRGSDPIELTPAAVTLLECLEKLIPIYQRMKMILDGFGAAESKRVHLNNQIEAAEALLQNIEDKKHSEPAEFDLIGATQSYGMYGFIDEWTDEESTTLMKVVKDQMRTEKTRRPESLDWDAVAAGLGGAHDADECRTEFDHITATAFVKKATSSLTALETKMKSQIKQKETIMVELSRADVTGTSNCD
eukprot:SAG31_NODE_16_length_36206_cov_27.355728_42_plen_294_part_00